MKIAFLHFAFCGRPQGENAAKILKGMKLAAEHGARWVLTPEMALQGYKMICSDLPFQLASVKNGLLLPFCEAAQKFKETLFLGCAFLDEDRPHNSCVVIGDEGGVLWRHDKLRVLKASAEKWAMPGEGFTVRELDGIRVGVLVCADMYYGAHGESLAAQNCELAIGIAAWPPGGHEEEPEVAWKRLSRTAGNIPLFVANQTGTKLMDFSKAQSAVAAEGELSFSYSGDEALLLLDFDEKRKQVASRDFTVIKI